MTVALEERRESGRWTLASLRNRLIASRRFQRWVASVPFARPWLHREGARLFDLMAGFAYSQTLHACVELDLLGRARGGPLSTAELAGVLDMPPERIVALCQAAAALDLLERHRDGRFALGRVGAEILSVPGIVELIRHHAHFYRDLGDPVGLLRGTAQTELSAYWPYTQQQEVETRAADPYSKLMAATQAMVSEDVLRNVRLGDARHLMDVAGGSGTFLCSVAKAYPALRLTLFELPPVIEIACDRLKRSGHAGRVGLASGDFRSDELPKGADVITLVRVLFDHGDGRVANLLRRVFKALPKRGRVIVAEPMSGGSVPCRFGDAYFGLYTMAMGTGQVRSPARLAELLGEAGFQDVHLAPGGRPYVARVLTACKPG